jgi:hypothetical protein
MFGQFSELIGSEAHFKAEQYRQEADRERLTRQAKSKRQAKRSHQTDILDDVKRGKLSIEEGLNLLENV